MNCVEDINSAGYLIAMEDMNIRGAGEILGNKQHGAIESFGYDSVSYTHLRAHET